jgi:hypothetical protein
MPNNKPYERTIQSSQLHKSCTYSQTTETIPDATISFENIHETCYSYGKNSYFKPNYARYYSPTQISRKFKQTRWQDLQSRHGFYRTLLPPSNSDNQTRPHQPNCANITMHYIFSIIQRPASFLMDAKKDFRYSDTFTWSTWNNCHPHEPTHQLSENSKKHLSATIPNQRFLMQEWHLFIWAKELSVA